MKAPPKAAAVTAPAPTAARVATWGRVYGDLEKRENNIASFTLAGQQFTRDLSYDERGGGLLAGVDVVLSNLTSAADGLIIGPFGGYTTARLNFNKAGVNQNFSGATVGAKATYVNGGFFANAIVKADLLSLDITATGIDQRSDLTNLSLLGNVGYKFDVSGGFYVEPTAGVEYVRTDFSDSPLLTPTTVPLLDGHVTRLRAGARFGTEWVTNNIRIEPSVLPLVYYIADASGLETFTAGGPGVITFPNDQGRVFGEVQASVNFFDLSSGWSGFVRGDVRFGNDLIGGSGKGGIRYTW
jgi:outer membrane autotransporter protein